MRQAMIGAALAAGLGAGAAQAQQFTTAAEVRPILEATRASWIALREYDGQDLLYFTQLIAWRCGLNGVTFSVNADTAGMPWIMEPCHEGTAQPNAITSEEVQPYIALPLGLVQSVTVAVELDDGTVLRESFDRAQVLMP